MTRLENRPGRLSGRQVGVVFAGLSIIAASSVAQTQFVDVTASAGVEFFQEGGVGMPFGGGAVWADYDGDGDDDLYVTQGIGCNRLFANDGAGTFTEVADAAGASNCLSTSRGATAADYDNDGDQDYYVTNLGQNKFYKNMLTETGSPDLVDFTAAAGMDNDGAMPSSSAVWGDYNGDGFLDLFVGNHATTMEPLDCQPDLVYRNNGAGGFDEVGGDLGIALSGDPNEPGCALAATWSDYDNDGDLDLMIINDFGTRAIPNRLFRNDGPSNPPGSWVFTDVSVSSRFDYEMAGMGIAIGDMDLDGDFDYYMSDAGQNNLASNNNDGTFNDVTVGAGVEAAEQEIWGGTAGLVSWGTAFYDLDHDGLEDLIVANGGAPESLYPGMFGADYVDLNPNYVYINQRRPNPFLEQHTELGITAEGYFRSLAVADYDDDGDVDLYFGPMHEFNKFYRNDLSGVPWLKVKARGTIGNADAVGARVVIVGNNGRSLMREIDGGSTFLSMNSRTAHFGLGLNVSRLEQVIVTFLGGLTYELRRVDGNQTVEVVEPIYVTGTSVDSATLSPGDSLSVDVSLENLTDEAATVDRWIDLVRTDDSEQTISDPVATSLGPNETLVFPVTIDVPAAAPLGEYDLVSRVGTYPDQVIHQSFIDVTIQ